MHIGTPACSGNAATPAGSKETFGASSGTPVTMEAMSALLATQLAPITGSVNRLESDFHTFRAEVHTDIAEVKLAGNQLKSDLEQVKFRIAKVEEKNIDQSFAEVQKQVDGDNVEMKKWQQEIAQKLANVENSLANRAVVKGLHATTSTVMFAGLADLTRTMADEWVNRMLKEMNLEASTNMYHKGDFKGQVFADFSGPVVAQKVVDAIDALKPKIADKAVWCKPNRPIEIRTPLSALLGLRWQLIRWGFTKSEIKVEEDDMTMMVNRIPVVSATFVEKKIKLTWLEDTWDTWEELQKSPALKKIVDVANGKLESSFATQRKGKGKGPTAAGQGQSY